MKNLFFCAFAVAALFCAADDLVYSCSFEPEEGFSCGEVLDQGGWDVKDGRHNYDSVFDVTNRTEIVKSGSQSLAMRTKEGDVNPFVGVNFDIEGGVENKYVVFSGDFMHPAGKKGWVKLCFADSRDCACFIGSVRDGYHSIKLAYTDLATGSYKEETVKQVPDDTYSHYELVVDPLRKAIISCSVDDVIITNTASRIMGYEKYDSSKEPIPDRICLECDVSADNLKIETRAAEHKPASLTLSQKFVYLDLEKDSADFSVVNSGSDPFDFTVTADGNPEWLTISPASGSCSAAQKVTLTVDRSALGEKFYRTILTVNAGSAGTKTLFLGVASGKVLLYEDFEEPYLKSGEITGQGLWDGQRDDNYGQPYNAMVVTNVSYGFAGNCAHLIRGAGWDGYTCKAKSPKQAMVKISLMLYCAAESDANSFSIHENYWGNCADFQFKREEDRLALTKFNDGPKYALTGDYRAPLDEWIPFSFTMDLESYLLTSVTLGDFSTNYSEGFVLRNAPNEHVNPVERLDYFAISADGSQTSDAMIFIDDLSAELAEKSADSKLVVPSEAVYAERSADSVTFQVRNAGTVPFDFTVSAEGDPEWLTVEPAEGTCSGSENVKLTLARDRMTNGFYKAVISVDAGSAGQKSFFLFAPSGSVVMYEDFEPPFMLPGEITGQGLWNGKKDDGYGQPFNEMIVTNVDYGYDGACAHVYRGGGWDGYTMKAKCDKEAVVRVSMMLRFGSRSDQGSFFIRQNYWGNCAQFQFKRHDDHFNLYKLNEDETYKLVGEHPEYLDEWVPFSYTLDYKAYKLTSVTFGSYTTNYAEGMTLWNAPNDRVNPVERFEYFAVTAGGSETEDAEVCLDNILVEQIERPHAALPIWTGAIALGDQISCATNKLSNLGSVDFSYTLLFSGYTKGLSLAKQEGTGSKDGNVIIRLDRSAVGEGFHRAYLTMDYQAVDGSNSGSLKCFITFSKGGWFYTSEFEGTGYELGFLNGQDTWSAYTWGTEEPSVVMKDGLQCLSFPYDSSASALVAVPPETPYRTYLRFYMEDRRKPYLLRVTANNKKKGGDGNLPVYVVYDPSKGNLASVYYQNDGDPDCKLLEAPLEQWNELSFVLNTDVASSCAVSLTLNDYTTNFYEGEIVLNPDLDGLPLDVFEITAYNLKEDDEVGVYVDNLVLCDANIPEPVCLTLILAMAALLSARKN